ncbi:MAG: hypothetical protein BMS9Abin01_1480 [Gammaproteobacteria bacterium]|nr:MAG: hypothetical protein BMS9Abin01_1480 [Gammaproteobacteria bacterium]
MNATTLPCTAGHRCQVTRERKRWYEPGRMIGRILAWLKLWYDEYRQHANLARLNDRLLNDVGLQREDVIRVAREPFWRL